MPMSFWDWGGSMFRAMQTLWSLLFLLVSLLHDRVFDRAGAQTTLIHREMLNTIGDKTITYLGELTLNYLAKMTLPKSFAN